MTAVHNSTGSDLTATTEVVHLRPDLPVTVTRAGTGRPVLVLHGGGGPATVAPLVEHLRQTVHVIAPTQPGWDGTPRPAWLSGIGDYALTYLRYLGDQGLTDVAVVGSSLGGWVGAEMTVRDEAHLVSSLVLIDAVGVDVPGQPIADVFALDARGVVERSFADPARFFVDPATVPDQVRRTQAANRESMREVAGDPYMCDPSLLGRLGRVSVPTLALWGESDRIVTPAYGAAYAAAFRTGTFELIPRAGHLPQLEQPAATFAALDRHLGLAR